MTTPAERPALTRRRAYLVSLIPGAAVTILIVAVAAVLGGPIGAALAGFVFVSVLLADALLMALGVLWRTPRSTPWALLWGLAGYLVGLGMVSLWLTWFGPSQIM